MDSETDKVLTDTGALTHNLLALLIVEMRKANEIAQHQQNILQELVMEMSRTQALMNMIRTQVGY
jgi:hypothetical protein